MENYLTFVFGNVTPATYLAAFTMMLLGMLFIWAYRIKRSMRNNPATPEKFSFKYLFKTSFFQICISLILGVVGGFLLLRLTNEIFGVELSAAVAVVFGLAFDIMLDKLASFKGNIKI